MNVEKITVPGLAGRKAPGGVVEDKAGRGHDGSAPLADWCRPGVGRRETADFSPPPSS